MLAWLVSTCACLAAAQDAPPFRLELPDGYAPFVRERPELELWRSLRAGGGGQFLLARWTLDAPGALVEAISARSRAEQWQPLLAEWKPVLTPWRGTWAGQVAAGSEIRYQRSGQSQAVLERFLVLGDRLVVGSWEGPQGELAAAAAAFDGFALPADWIPPAAPAVDAERGLGPTASVLPAPGHLQLAIETAPDFGSIAVELVFLPDPDLGWQPDPAPTWLPPAMASAVSGPERLDDGRYRLRYTISLADVDAAAAAGLHQTPGALAAIEPGWMSCPLPPQAAGQPEATLSAPSWELSLRVPVHLTALSWSAPAREGLLAAEGRRSLAFAPLPAGRSWPFFLIGPYSTRELAGTRLHLRGGARSLAAEAQLRCIAGMKEAASGWLPSAAVDWAVASFPGCGDHQFPGLLILDESSGWWSEPLDASWWRGQSRRAGLAQRVAEQVLRSSLRGVGSAAPFLDASLSAYAAWRLLEASGRVREAASWEAHWSSSEQAAPALAAPLSLLGVADLRGQERLLTRGPLVWRAIERELGRARLDACLEERLRRGGSWTSEDLRADLERHSGGNWDDFFQRYVYGRERP